MMDENSLVVLYDNKRGEPRRGTPEVAKEDEGDCINCYNCVKVCPTGIDIRRGTQLECIACTNCIDACDEIMIKVKRPTGLIRYGAETEVAGVKRKLITARSIVYAFISLFLIMCFVIFLNNSSKLDLIFIRGGETFTQTAQEVTNRFTLRFNHQGDQTYKLIFRLKDQSLIKKVKIITPVIPILLHQHEKKVIVFFQFDKSILIHGTKIIEVDVFDQIDQIVVATKEVVLVGPAN